MRLFYDLVNFLPFGVFKILLLAEVKIFVKARRARPIRAVAVKFNPRVKQEQIALPQTLFTGQCVRLCGVFVDRDNRRKAKRELALFLKDELGVKKQLLFAHAFALGAHERGKFVKPLGA